MKRYHSSILLFFGILFLNSCGEFISSPYISKTKNRNLNGHNLNKITSRSGNFTNTFKIAVLSDTHDYYSELAKQVDYINKHSDEIAFVLHTGDATNLGMLVEWEMFKGFIDKLKVPFMMVIGNHDMLTRGVDIYSQMFGDELNFSFVFKQTRFIFINNNNWESHRTAPDLDYLESELSSASETNKIILGHVQPDDSARYSKTQISQMENVVNTYNVNYFINGHNHNYGSGPFGNATRVTVGSPVKDKILILSISDGGVSHSHINY